MNRYHALVLDPAGQRLLAFESAGGFTLPVCTSPRWTPEVGEFLPALEAALGRPVRVRECLEVEIDRSVQPQARTALYLCSAPVLPEAPVAGPPGSTLIWLPASRRHELTDRWCRERIAALSFDEESAGARLPRGLVWRRAGAYDDVCDWLERALEALDLTALERPRQLKHWDLSALLTVETRAGTLYVKCVPHFFAQEPSITARLAELFPEWVPRPLATLLGPEEGRLLLADFAGPLVRHTPDGVLGLREPLRRLAGMQLRSLPELAGLLRAGCASRPVAGLPGELAQVLAHPLTQTLVPAATRERLHERMPVIERDCQRLSELGVPESLVHGDFHDGNVSVRAQGHVIFDWSDAAVSHPFFDLPVALGVPEHRLPTEQQQLLLQAYLEPWRAAGFAAERLDAALELGLRLGLLYHAVSYHRILAACGPVTRAELGPTLGALLARFSE